MKMFLMGVLGFGVLVCAVGCSSASAKPEAKARAARLTPAQLDKWNAADRASEKLGSETRETAKHLLDALQALVNKADTPNETARKLVREEAGIKPDDKVQIDPDTGLISDVKPPESKQANAAPQKPATK